MAAADEASMLTQFKTGLAQRGEYSRQTAVAFTYKNDPRLLASSPGHIDFPAAVALSVVPPSEILANPTETFLNISPLHPESPIS